MKQHQNLYTIRIFHSYSHRDFDHRKSMERTLVAIQPKGIISQWSDNHTLAGRSISDQIRAKMDEVDIAIFLLSPDFIASPSCREEWNYFRELESQGKSVFRIPIILRQCPWQDFLGKDDVKALPNDGQPVTSFQDEDEAWHQIYEGVKQVVNQIRITFTPTEEHLSTINQTEFLADTHLKLEDTFVFPRLTRVESLSHGRKISDTKIFDQSELLSFKHVLVYGQENSGKTALARHLYLSLLKVSHPVLLVEFEHMAGKHKETFLRAYRSQYQGDYSLWCQQSVKTLIMDTTTAPAHLHELIELAKESFDQVIVILSTDDYYAYFKDHFRMLDFRHMKIDPLTLDLQEKLIKKRLRLSHSEKELPDGLVDQVENRVNSIVISNRILPRYPFYILSILQTYEAYMPAGMSITSYGHCYLVLIIANLIRSGIAREDDQLNACFNFAEHLAHAIYRSDEKGCNEPFEFKNFLAKYKKKFIIKDSIVNCLKRKPYGLIDSGGNFRVKYMFYYFLGKYLANNSNEEGVSIIESMCRNSHKEINYLTILFTIHHTNDTNIIDDILSKTKGTLDFVPVAKLDSDETKKFANFIDQLPGDVQSNNSVAKEREIERARQSKLVDGGDDLSERSDVPGVDEISHGIYRILKNNKIMGQVLRTKYGNLERVKIQEIITAIADSGLRLVNLLLQDESELEKYAMRLHAQSPDSDLNDIKEALQVISYLWTMVHVGMVVSEVSVPEIQGTVQMVAQQKNTAAYDLIKYFALLDSAEQLTSTERDVLYRLWKDRDDVFFRHVLSIRTQQYMNTHRSKASIEQSICRRLGITYRPKPVQED